MSSSRTTGPLLGRLAAAAAGAAMRGKSNGGGALRAIVESSSTPSMLFAGLQCRPYATSSWIKVRKREGSPPLSRPREMEEGERERERAPADEWKKWRCRHRRTPHVEPPFSLLFPAHVGRFCLFFWSWGGESDITFTTRDPFLRERHPRRETTTRKRFVSPEFFFSTNGLGLGEKKLQPQPLSLSFSLKKQLFKPAQAFFGGGSSGSGSAASTSAVTAAATVPTAAAAAPPQFGFAASAPARAPPASPPKKAGGAAAAGTPPTKKKKVRVPRGPTAYALFLKEQLAAAPAGDARSFAQRSAAVAAAWKVLPPASRARFEAASRAAKAALPPREASKPARALSGYQLFVREKLPTLRDEGVPGGAGAVSAMRAAATAWSSAPAQVKAEFAARAKAMGTKR